MGSSASQNLESSSGVVYTDAGVSRVCVMEVEAVNTADVGLQVRQMQQTWEALSLKYSMLDFIHGPALAALYVGAMVSATCRCGWADA